MNEGISLQGRSAGAYNEKGTAKISGEMRVVGGTPVLSALLYLVGLGETERERDGGISLFSLLHFFSNVFFLARVEGNA
jgi:hypothetical protein